MTNSTSSSRPVMAGFGAVFAVFAPDATRLVLALDGDRSGLWNAYAPLLMVAIAVGVIVALGSALLRSLPERTRCFAWSGLLALGWTLAVQRLTSGAWISTQTWVWPLRIASSCGGVAALAFVARTLARSAWWERPASWLALMALGAGALGTGAVRHPVLDHYPAAAATLLAGSVAASAVFFARLSPRLGRGVPFFLSIFIVLLLICGIATFAAPPTGAARILLVQRTRVGSLILRFVLPQEEVTTDPAASVRARELLRRGSFTDATTLDVLFPERRRYNLVVVMVDTLRPDHLSLYGYTRRETSPRLAEFARDCAVFDAAYAQYPKSSLSLASMLRGLYPVAADPRRPTTQSPDFSDVKSLPEVLRQHGRKTTGVFAMNDAMVARDFPYLAHGLDHFLRPAVEEWTLHDTLGQGSKTLPSDGSPFYLWVHILEPHGPYLPHEGFTVGSWSMDLYDGEIAFTDHHLGAFLDLLRERDDWDRTVVLIHSDHGEEFEEHGGYFHGTRVYEEQVRVPLLLRIPGLPATRVSEPVELVDLYPTLINLLTGEAPPKTHGHDLTPLILPKTLKKRGEVPAPLAYMQLGDHRGIRMHGVRHGDDKLILDLTSGTYEGYDLKADPKEQRPLALRSIDPLLVALLNAFAAETLTDSTANAAWVDPIEGAIARGDLPAARDGLRRAFHEERDVLVRRILLDALRSEHAEIRRFAVEFLPLTPNDGLSDLLLPLLTDSDATVRAQAKLVQQLAIGQVTKLTPRDVANAVAQTFGEGETSSTLSDAFAHRSGRDRLRAAIGLAAVAMETATSPPADVTRLRALPQSLLLVDALDEDLRWLAYRVATLDPSPALLATLGDVHLRSAQMAWEARELLAAIRQVGAEEAVVLLRRLLKQPDPSLRRAALDLLSDPDREAVLSAAQTVEFTAAGFFETDAPRGAMMALDGYRRALEAGVVDMGLLTLAQRLLLATGSGQIAATATASAQESTQGHRVASALTKRLTDVARRSVLPASASLHPLALDESVVAGGSPATLLVTLRLATEGGSLPGGHGTLYAAHLLVHLHHEGKHHAGGLVFLPPSGLLPGEEIPLLIPVSVPEFFAGTVDVEIELRPSLLRPPLLDVFRHSLRIVAP